MKSALPWDGTTTAIFDSPAHRQSFTDEPRSYLSGK